MLTLLQILSNEHKHYQIKGGGLSVFLWSGALKKWMIIIQVVDESQENLKGHTAFHLGSWIMQQLASWLLHI